MIAVLPKRRIAEALAAKAAAYELQAVFACDQCSMKFTTRVGLREHRSGHWQARHRPIIRYWVDVSKLPALVVIRWEE